MEDVHPQGAHVCGQQGAWCYHPHFGNAQGVQGHDLGAGHPGMLHISDNGDAQWCKVALVPADGEHIQHCLGRVGMAAIAGIDDADAGCCMLGNEMSGTGCAVAYHEHVTVHGFDIAQGVE